MLDLFPFQATGAQWLAPKQQALLCDEMGLGKSAQAIRAADMVGAENILVFCPASVRVNWEREFERFSPMDRPCSVIFSSKDKVPQGGVVIVSYDLAVNLADKLKRVEWDLLVLDEAHYLKERSAKRTRAIYGRGPKWPGIAAHAKRVWRLTGTPAPNNASELWTHLNTAGVVAEPFWDFTYRYCSGWEGGYGYQITGHKNTEELKRRMQPILLRRTKEEVMPDLPPIRYTEVTVERSAVELDPVFFEQVHKAGGETQLLDQITVADQTLRTALSAISITARQPNEDRLAVLEGLAPSMVTLRRYIGMAKLPACLDIIEEELKANPKFKIVLFAVHQSVIEGARERLAKYGAVTLYGATPARKRQFNIDRFSKDPKCRVFVGNVQAAGTGINLTTTNEAAFLEQSWVPAENAQAAMRVHRIGQTRPVRIRIFSLHRSVDEQVQATLTRKMRELARIDL